MLNELLRIKNELEIFTDPSNEKGFVRHFYLWVIKNWETRSYYETQVVDQGFDISYYPLKTTLSLKEKATTYCEFINSNNGNSYATFYSGSGIACKSIEENLSYYYMELIEKLIKDIQPQLPDSLKEEYADMYEAIMSEAFEKEKEEYDICEDIILTFFGSPPLALEMYTCPIVGPDEYDLKLFGGWKLEDFKKKCIY